MGWISGISVLCFAASYLVALGLEVSRLVLQGTLRRAGTMAFAWAGFVAHTLFLVYRGMETGGLPLSSLYDWLLVLSWLLVIVYLYWSVHQREMAMGVFVLPVVLAIVVVAWWFVDSTPRTLGAVLGFWGRVHGALLGLGTLAVVAGFLAGLMYLVQARRLKAKHTAWQGFRLPSLERLERFNGRAITVAFPLLTLGLLLGLGLAVYSSSQRHEIAVRFGDPKVISAGAMWLVFALLLHARYQPELRGRKVAYLTIVAFGFLLFTLVGIELLPLETWHSADVSEPLARGGGP